MLYTYVTISTAAAQPVQAVSGASLTVTADIRQNDNSDAIQANPTGSITFFWLPLRETSGPVIATSTDFKVITPFLDTQVTATLTLKSVSSFDGAQSDNFGDYLIIAGYSGDANFGANGSGNGVDAQNLTTRVDPNDRYIPVDFVASTAGSIAVTAQPGNTAVGDKFDPPVQVSFLDSAGSVDTTSSASITVSLASTSTGTGTLGGTKTVSAVNGVAAFGDLSVDKPGQYSMTFSDGSGDTTSSGLFQISGGKLVFINSPKNGTVGVALKPFTVALEDSHRAILTDADGTIVTLTPITTTTASPAVSGNSAPLVHGVATFDHLVLEKAAFYTLKATDGGDAEMVSRKFKIGGVSLRSVRATVGSQRQTSSDDDLAITDANVFAVPTGLGEINLAAIGLTPATRQVLEDVKFAVVRNATDVKTGINPTVFSAAGTPLLATLTLLGEVGSFNVICYDDLNGDSTYEPGEELQVFHLAEVDVVVQPGGTEASSDAFFSATDDGSNTLIGSGDFVSKYAVTQKESVNVIGGGPDGLIGVDKIHLGYVQNGTSDNVQFGYGGGTRIAEVLRGATFPIVDSSYTQAQDNAFPSAIFGTPLDTHRPLPDSEVETVTGNDPAGGQDRTLDTGDSPAIGAPDRHGNNHLLTAAGTLGFTSVLSAYSDSFDRAFTGYLRFDWSATYNYTYATAADGTGAWQNTGSTVSGTAMTLEIPATLEFLGVKTTGPVYIHAEGLRVVR